MDWPLYWRLPPKNESTSDEILNRFLEYVGSKDLELYPAQEEAILALLDGQNVILNTPTGSGKSLVAMALHFQSLAKGRRSFYTCPIKALVNEKFRDLCAAFGPDQVGMITGDGAINGRAPIICCTAEILSNLALREGPLAPVDDVVMDEFHYYSDKQRGVAWQIPLLSLPQTRFLLMSATLGEMDFFAKALTDLNAQPTQVVTSTDRPVPLDFTYAETPLHETVADLIARDLSPIYLVNFSQREAAEEAQNLMSVNFSSKEDKKAIADALVGIKFQSPYGKEIQKVVKHGIGLHHAGLLPKYRALVERLAQKGLLKVISGTDTLGVGVNVPIRTVLFTKLCKYDGEKTQVLSVREFHQIAGRAGRRGFDVRGNVVAQAPAHVIENNRMKAKAANDPKKARKLVMKGPPPRGFVMWTKETFNKLMTSTPEALVSRFRIDHGMLLNVLNRDGGARAMQRLIQRSHGHPPGKRVLRKSAFELFRSLRDRGIVDVKRDNGQTRVTVNTDLQTDFSLNQSLSLYMLDTLKLLDRSSENYALDVLTLVESILESPDQILRKQLDRVKTEKMFEMKAEGIEYDERIEKLDELEYPKPNRDFIYDTFNAFREAHPWVGQENIRPKSIAREMFENFHAFGEYIREYELQRIEGLLLRYLTDVYKTLEQSVPDAAKDEEVFYMSTYFGEMVRGVDSSLLDDWEKLRAGEVAGVPTTASAPEVAAPPRLDHRQMVRLMRNAVFAFVRALGHRDFEELLTLIAPDPRWTAETLAARLDEFVADGRRLRLDPAARAPRHLDIKEDGTVWNLEQIVVDTDEHNDWQLSFAVETAGLPEEPLVLILKEFGPV